jgi:hypothetical protein
MIATSRCAVATSWNGWREALFAGIFRGRPAILPGVLNLDRVTMTISRMILLLMSCIPLSAAAKSAPVPLGVEAQIGGGAFGIRNFEARTEDAIWIQDQGFRWYYAVLEVPCRGLPTSPQVGFLPRGSSSLDRFGAVVSDGDLCEIKSLVTSEPPPKKVKTKKAKPAPAAAPVS